MSDVLTVQTSFGDVADLAQGFIGRVNARQIVVLAGEAIATGQAVRFQVLLADGTLAFWADGQCAQAKDLGEDADPNARYELFLHSLEFPDERSLPVFEYMVSLSESATPSDELTASEESEAFTEPPTGEVGTDELEAVEAVSAAPGDIMSAPPSAPAPAPAPEPEPAPYESEVPRALSDRPGPPPGGVLTRMATGNAWRPARPEKRPPTPRSGLFKYAFGPLPLPSKPPRPVLDPAQAVTPAPRPGA